MKFALLGDDPACLSLLRAIGRSREHRLAGAAHAERLASVLRIPPAAPELCGHWRELELRGPFDAVIVAGCGAEVLEGARRFAASRTMLVVWPDAGQESAFAYELSLLADEAAKQFLPVFPYRFHPDLGELRRRLAFGELGIVQLIQCERWLSPAALRTNVQPAEVDGCLLHDGDLLRWIGGDYDQVTALHLGKSEGGAQAGVSLATVKLAGSSLPEATWMLRRAVSNVAWRVSVVAERGTFTVEGAKSDPDPAVQAQPSSAANAALTDAAGDAVLAEIAQVHRGAPGSAQWTDLMRAFDIVDAARRSVRRRRTIDLHFDTASERSQFKTQMTAMGCGVLSLTLVAVIGLLVAGAALDPRTAAQRRAEADGFLFEPAEFDPSGMQLTRTGQYHLQRVADQWGHTSAAVIIAAEGPESHDAQRRDAVVAELVAAGVPPAEAADRTVARPIAGRWFRRLLIAAWVVVFLPLFVFLILQGLIVLARPSRRDAD